MKTFLWRSGLFWGIIMLACALLEWSCGIGPGWSEESNAAIDACKAQAETRAISIAGVGSVVYLLASVLYWRSRRGKGARCRQAWQEIQFLQKKRS